MVLVVLAAALAARCWDVDAAVVLELGGRGGDDGKSLSASDLRFRLHRHDVHFLYTHHEHNPPPLLPRPHPRHHHPDHHHHDHHHHHHRRQGHRHHQHHQHHQRH